jgi:hypothetical protein
MSAPEFDESDQWVHRPTHCKRYLTMHPEDSFVSIWADFNQQVIESKMKFSKDNVRDPLNSSLRVIRYRADVEDRCT